MVEALLPAPVPVTAPCAFDIEWNGYYGDRSTGITCGDPSAATVTVACVHEHIDKPRACTGYALDVACAAGEITCPHCWNGPDRHDCYGLVVIEWDSGERTTVQEGAARAKS